MTGQCWGQRRTWLGVALVVTVVIALQALGAGSAQAAGDPSAPRSIVLAGFTSQRLPVFFKISGDGRVLVASGIAIRLRCTSGGQLVVPDAFAHIPIAANGRLHISFSPPETTENGITTNATDTFSARLDPTHSKLTGTWRLKLHFSMASGASVACDTGLVHFDATG
jgi:hypothetical protein